MANTNIDRIEALEDNGGGLHLAIFQGDTCTHLFSGFEHGGDKAPSLQEEIAGALADGVSGWDGGAESPEREYADLTGKQYGWKMIAECDMGAVSPTVHEDDMGTAGRKWARIAPDEE